MLHCGNNLPQEKHTDCVFTLTPILEKTFIVNSILVQTQLRTTTALCLANLSHYFDIVIAVNVLVLQVATLVQFEISPRQLTVNSP